MSEVEQHWEPNLESEVRRSEDPLTIEVVVTASFAGEDPHTVGGASIYRKPLPEGKFEVFVRAHGIIEYAAHALKQECGLTLVIDENGMLAVKEEVV
jgi:hypothetical protein